MNISVSLLREKGACEDQVEQFARTFGDSVTLTPETWDAARAAGLDVLWCANLLDAPAWAEYEKVRASALAAYEKGRASALLAALMGASKVVS